MEPYAPDAEAGAPKSLRLRRALFSSVFQLQQIRLVFARVIVLGHDPKAQGQHSAAVQYVSRNILRMSILLRHYTHISFSDDNCASPSHRYATNGPSRAAL
jgi:hypothetical protein